MIRAYAVQEPVGWTVALTVAVHPEPGDRDGKTRILRLGNRGVDGTLISDTRWEEVDPDERYEPTLRISADAAFALADALGELRHGTGELRALRKDYDDERGRVDALIKVLSTVATDGER